jgi:hypothetical protein
MPVIRYIPQDPTDTVLQGEQLRGSNEDARPSYPGNVILGRDDSINGLSDLTQDEDAFLPMNSFVEGNRLSVRRNRAGIFQIRSNAGIATPCGEWVSLDTSPLLLYTVGGYERLSLAGVSRDSAGAALGTCVVKIFLTVNDVKQFEKTSDGSGNWSVADSELGANPGPFYYVEYKVGSPDRAGTSINTNVPTKVN